MLRTNALAYFELLVSDIEKTFKTLILGDNVMIFSSSQMNRPNKLEHLSLTSLSSLA